MSIISSNILSVILVTFITIMVKRNTMLSKYDTKFFLFAGIANIALLILETLDFYLSDTYFPGVLSCRYIINSLGFALSPVIPYFLVSFNINKKSKNKFYWGIPLYLNIIVCLFSLGKGWVFILYPPNNYIRGDLFAIPFVVSLFYMLLLVVIIVKNNKDYSIGEVAFITVILSTIIMCFALQIAISGLYLIWSSVSIGLLIYYMFLREMQFKYDIMTGIRNRATFEKDIVKSQKINNVGIVIVDINNLKAINDQKGHIIGDSAIINTAKVLQKSFEDIGNCYRIGGDEYCVICCNCSEEQIKNALHTLERLLSELNKDSYIKINIAYGYTLFKKHSDKSIFEAFAKADAAMYKHKMEGKQKIQQQQAQNLQTPLQ